MVIVALLFGAALAYSHKKLRSKSAAGLWQAYERKIKEAKQHPHTDILDTFFLHPDSLSHDIRESAHQHVAGCKRCQKIQKEYDEHRDAFLHMKKEPCD